MTERKAPAKLSQIPGYDVEWMVEWDGGHAVQTGLTAFQAHSRVHGAPAFGSCCVWRSDDNPAEPLSDQQANGAPAPETTKEAERI